MKIYYTATAKYSPTTGRTYQGIHMNWQGYIAWSKLTHVKEIITLDAILGEIIVKEDYQLDIQYWHWYKSKYFISLVHLLSRVKGIDPSTYNVLAFIEKPTLACENIELEGFDFMGYDLLELPGAMSALTNCGGFDNTFLPRDLNEYGLISTYQKASTIKEELFKNNPDEHHAKCDMWAIWRKR